MASPSPSANEFLTGPEGAGVLYLLDAAGEYEARLLTKWLEKQVREPNTVQISPSRRRRREPVLDPEPILQRVHQPASYQRDAPAFSRNAFAFGVPSSLR